MSDTNQKTHLLQRIPIWLRIVALLLLVVLIAFFSTRSDTIDLPMVTVNRGDFVVDINEAGRLRAENSMTLTTPSVRGNRTIIYLIPEGSNVVEGDILAQFDTTEFKQKVDDYQAEVEITRENMTSTMISMRSRMEDIKASVQNAKASYRLAELRLEQLKFESDIQIEEGELNLLQAQLRLTQTELEVKSQSQIDSAEVRSMRLKLKQDELELEKTILEMEKLTIRAPASGLVVYKEVWKGGEMAKVKVGDNPWPGQAIIELPDLSIMMVETTVSEVDVGKIKVGLDVEIKLDAYPDPTFHGEVVDVAVLAHDDDGSDAQVFDVLIRLEESDPILRPGMSTTSRIIINRLEDRLSVPIEAVFRSDGKTVIWEANGSGWTEKEVVLGKRNDNFVVIVSGIEEGAKIALVDPNVAKEDRIGNIDLSEDSTGGGGSSPTTSAEKPSKRPSRRSRGG